MDTDQKYSERRFSLARIRSLDSDPEQSEAKPESGPKNPCSSGHICGSFLHGHDLAFGAGEVLCASENIVAEL